MVPIRPAKYVTTPPRPALPRPVPCLHLTNPVFNPVSPTTHSSNASVARGDTFTGFQKPPGMFLSHNSMVDFWSRFQNHPAGVNSIRASKNLPGSIWSPRDIFLDSQSYCGTIFQTFSPTVVQNSPIGNNPTDHREIYEVKKNPPVISGYINVDFLLSM